MTTITNGNGHTAREEGRGISRREFLFYLGAGSAALFGAGVCGGVYWFTQQRLVYGAVSGVFNLEFTDLPQSENAPVFHQPSRSWLTLTDTGLFALNARCIRDRYLFKWVENNNRYECPGCGSKYRIDGSYIEGPANRGADRYTLLVQMPEGTRTTPADGAPVSLEGAEAVIVDTRQVISDLAHPTPTPFLLGGDR